ncbi:MAG TPA: cyclic nucleotide-binding domain-containing protein, partial [Polyangiaceae bacterium]|nr:cyclic nucleotide-binding domain-containing protein [Polyangiaceae bacterium]
MTAGLAARIPLLACLDPEQRRQIDALFEVRLYADRETVVWEGDAADAVFVVLSGYLKACNLGPDGRELLLSVMGPGEVVGELSLLDGQPRSATVVALEAVKLAAIDRESFMHLVDGSSKLSMALLRVVTQRLRNLSKRCE